MSHEVLRPSIASNICDLFRSHRPYSLSLVRSTQSGTATNGTERHRVMKQAKTAQSGISWLMVRMQRIVVFQSRFKIARYSI